MATLLYEELGVQATATTEEIKKAYRKRALQTHPDRLPPTSSEEQKKDAEEKFRKVNHAYEILTDPTKRQEYDAHGVWPPPVEEIPRTSTSNGAYGSHFDPFGGFSHRHHHQQFPSFVFQDPFALFNSIFADVMGPRSAFGFQSGPAFFEDPFERFERLEREMEQREREMNARFTGFNTNPMASPFTVFGGFGGGGLLGSSSHFGMLPEPPRRGSGGPRGGSGKWASESYMTQSINGVTQTIHKRRDWEGNEHVTRTFPDGRKVHTINGVEQPSHGNLPSSAERRQISAPSREPQRLPPVDSSSLSPPSYSSSYGGSQGFYHNAPPSGSQMYHASSVHNYVAPQPHSIPANPQATRKSHHHLTETPQPHAAPAPAATTVYSQDRDRGHSHHRRSRDSESLHESDHQHQNHLHGTHQKSRNPYHPNPAPYYLDDVDRDSYHGKHHPRRRPWDKR